MIRCLLIIPFPESSLNEEAAKLFMENYEEYARHAKIYTNVYATGKSKERLEKAYHSPTKMIRCENTMTAGGDLPEKKISLEKVERFSPMKDRFYKGEKGVKKKTEEVLTPLINHSVMHHNPVLKKVSPFAAGAKMTQKTVPNDKKKWMKRI